MRTCAAEHQIRFYQASSSEMFGLVKEVPQNENTPFHPRSPYAVAKTFGHYTSQNYREAYGLHVRSGILFNHEGEYRGYEFVSRKITSNIARIKLGKQSRFSLGDLTPKRDWGYAGDYVEAMWAMLQQEKPDDYVIATGQPHSVQEFVEAALRCADLDGEITDYVDFDQNLVRPAEVPLLVGDASKAKRVLGWKPNVDFSGLVELMVRNDIEIESKI
jgi:GDPmannose 4,6-dehydratase